MKKRNKCLVIILTVLMLFSVVQVFDFVHVKADEMPSVETLLEATNTYNLNGDVTRGTKTGYTNPQYEFKFDMIEKNTNQMTVYPYVTVFTHGYRSSARDWMNNMEYIQQRSKSDITYNEYSMVNKVVAPYVIGAESFWSLSTITWS